MVQQETTNGDAARHWSGDLVSTKESAVDRLVGRIRGLIRERDLSFGDALPPERELGELFQAGRNSVREALQVLRAYGIIEVKPKAGAVISDRHFEAVLKLFSFQRDISPASFLDIQGFRRIIEIGIGDQIILDSSDAALDHLAAVNSRILDSRDGNEAAMHDFAFHEAIVELAGNRMLLTSYRLAEPVILQIMRLGKAERPVQQDTYRDHAEIIDALRTRDRIAYAYRMSRHLEYGLRFVGPAQRDGADTTGFSKQTAVQENDNGRV